MQFAVKQFEGHTYTFDHLQPRTIDLALQGRGQRHALRVDVTFGCHCFTEEFDVVIHSDHHRYTHEGEVRAFDVERYGCSLHLPQVLTTIASGTIYRSDTSYTYVTKITLQSRTGPVDYSMFFSLTKPSKADKTKPADRLLMYVKSAYPASLKSGPGAQNWRFKKLVCEVAGL